MKIQLDTTKKTIKVEEAVKLSKFMETVKKILPNNEWKDFTLETNTTIQGWSYPIYIERWTQPWYEQPWIHYCNNTSYSLNSGVYNIEV